MLHPKLIKESTIEGLNHSKQFNTILTALTSLMDVKKRYKLPEMEVNITIGYSVIDIKYVTNRFHVNLPINYTLCIDGDTPELLALLEASDPINIIKFNDGICSMYFKLYVLINLLKVYIASTEEAVRLKQHPKYQDRTINLICIPQSVLWFDRISVIDELVKQCEEIYNYYVDRVYNGDYYFNEIILPGMKVAHKDDHKRYGAITKVFDSYANITDNNVIYIDKEILYDNIYDIPVLDHEPIKDPIFKKYFDTSGPRFDDDIDPYSDKTRELVYCIMLEYIYYKQFYTTTKLIKMCDNEINDIGEDWPGFRYHYALLRIVVNSVWSGEIDISPNNQANIDTIVRKFDKWYQENEK